MSKKQRYAAGIEYVGSSYHGWQKQRDLDVPCVQACVESAVAKIANHEIEIVCAGRTDARVSASHQVVHFETTAVRSHHAWCMGINACLPDDIALLWLQPVSQDFHARFSALYRRYFYVIYAAPIKPAILLKSVTWTRKTLNVAHMNAAAQILQGEHDFSSFRAMGCQSKHPKREITHIEVYQKGDFIVIDVTANAFLYHMVRNIAGVLMKIGAGEAPVVWASEVLWAKDRKAGGVTAPPFGLYFVDVGYPDHFGLPKRKVGPVFIY